MKINRRSLLRGAGGVAVGLPFLEATMSRAQAATPIKRFVVMIHGQGTVLDRWKPAATGTNFTLPQMLAPLEPLKAKINVLSGIDNKVREIMSSNGHNAAGRSLLSAHEFYNKTNEGSPSAGPSIDQVLAQKLAAPTPMSTLALSVGGGVGEYQMLFSKPGVAVAASGDPASTATKFTRLIPSDMPKPPALTAADRLAAKRQSVLDAVKDNMKQLRDSLGAADQVRLDAHAERLAEMEKTFKAPAASGGVVSAACKKVDLALPAGFSPYDGRVEDVAVGAQIKNLVMGLSCDFARVGTLQLTNYHGPSFDWLKLGLSGNWHDRVHAAGGNDKEGMAKAFEWYGKAFYQLISQMQAIDEGDGSMLDHSLVLWISEFGDGGAHNTSKLPVVLAGGLGGALTTGRHLAFSGKTHNDLYTTILNLFGFNEKAFGHPSTDFNHGPLSLS